MRFLAVRSCLATCVFVVLAGCGGRSDLEVVLDTVAVEDAAFDGSPSPLDAGVDASRPRDGGHDAPLNMSRDAGADAPPDVATDAAMEAGTDAGAATDAGPDEEVYLKASNASAGDWFGVQLAISGDGNTLAVGANEEASGASGIDGDEQDISSPAAGAVYVFVRDGATWVQQAYVKASNPAPGAVFGVAVALSDDGSTLAVGASGESSGATGVNGNQNDTSDTGAGAVYVFTRAAATWSQQAYVKASNTLPYADFGSAVALSGDGSSLAVGSGEENSGATGIDGDQNDQSAPAAGAVYVFARSGTAWAQEAYVKASNTSAGANFGLFGLELSGDGSTMAVGAGGESSAATGVNGNQTDTSDPGAGAVYVFVKAGASWTQQAYVKASNTSAGASFGYWSVALSGDGSSLAVSAVGEASGATGIDGNQTDTSAPKSGAAYVFTRTATTWSQETYIKASNTRDGADFGSALALSADGNTLVVGSDDESSDATGIDGDQSDTSAPLSGAVYTFSRAVTPSGSTWLQDAYIKASNTTTAGAGAGFGYALALSGDGVTLAIGAWDEAGASSGVDGDQTSTSAPGAGAVYVFTQ